MKYIVILACLALLACNSSSQKAETKAESSIDWLVGEWVRTNGEQGENTYEIWTKAAEGYNGAAYTIVSGDTVFSEAIKAYLKDNHWNYEVSGPNETPVVFTSTAVTDTSFVCENPAHDFPKIIAYVKDGECINATISDGGGKEMLFRYERRVR